MSWETEVIVGREQDFPEAMVAVRMATKERVRYVPERTCHMSFIDEYETASGEEEYLCECSECGSQEWEPARDLPLYCRNCGRKAVDE